VPGIEPGPPDLWPRTLTTRQQRRSRSNKEAQNNKYIIRTTKNLIEDIHITTTTPLQQVRSYTNWNTTARHSSWYNKVTNKHRPKEPQRIHSKTPYGEIRWEHPLLSSININKTAFYIFYILYLAFKILTYPFLSYIYLDSPDHGTCLYAADSTDPLTYTVVTLIYILCIYYLKMATDRGRNM
jgi:hypothetical protein